MSGRALFRTLPIAKKHGFNTVQRQAELAGIGMPEVAVYDSPEINAFATGANRHNALVAVSTGLLRSMSRDEAEAVLLMRSATLPMEIW
ncbi:MAG: hypothetical protein Ct9H90mP25_3680 [Gammaproteobacteria bacterium]|nr:MAG: hypothetical protein Ct9H90mP25_3680 [Gammaproteobacteria bacterium]